MRDLRTAASLRTQIEQRHRAWLSARTGTPLVGSDPTRSPIRAQWGLTPRLRLAPTVGSDPLQLGMVYIFGKDT